MHLVEMLNVNERVCVGAYCLLSLEGALCRLVETPPYVNNLEDKKLIRR